MYIISNKSRKKNKKAEINFSAFNFNVGVIGFEPTTPSFRKNYATRSALRTAKGKNLKF